MIMKNVFFPLTCYVCSLRGQSNKLSPHISLYPYCATLLPSAPNGSMAEHSQVILIVCMHVTP